MSAGVGPATAALRAFKNSVKRTEGILESSLRG
jgi:hypothetical protein